MNKEYSAGGLITRKTNGQTEILLVKHMDNKFGFPKGHLEQGEDEVTAAKREIIEETGYLKVVVREKLGVIKRDSINFKGRHTIKDVTMFRAEVDGERHPNPEEEIIWVNLRDAAGRFWYAEDNEFFSQIKDKLEE